MKLGKLAPKYNSKTLLLSDYLTDALPVPPEKVYREYKIPADAWGMYANDRIGICACAEVAHHLMLVTAHTGKIFIPDEVDVIAMYSAISGYDPTTGLNDNGCAITDVLNYWHTTGLAGHKILGWAQIDHTNMIRRNQGIWLFGSNDVGVQLPAIAQQQFTDQQNWEIVPDDGGIEGGHCIMESGYGSEGSNYCTWGYGEQKASNDWNNQYVDESYVVLTSEWIEIASGLAPNGFNVDALIADLKVVAA
jgi:hypothetical protein